MKLLNNYTKWVETKLGGFDVMMFVYVDTDGTAVATDGSCLVAETGTTFDTGLYHDGANTGMKMDYVDYKVAMDMVDTDKRVELEDIAITEHAETEDHDAYHNFTFDGGFEFNVKTKYMKPFLDGVDNIAYTGKSVGRTAVRFEGVNRETGNKVVMVVGVLIIL